MAAVSNKNGVNNLPSGAPAMKFLSAQFTKRDLMLYALGIGCCDDSNDNQDEKNGELRFVYEHHPKFEAFPTFLLALSFIAERPSDDGLQFSFGIRSFPPESMTNIGHDGSNIGVLPKEFFKNQEDIEQVQNLPLLHMSQSLIFHDRIKFQKQTDQNTIDPPTQLHLQTRILSIKPRSIGTFMTSETKYYQDGSCIATAQMVSLILGLDPDNVVSLKAPANNHHVGRTRKIDQSTHESSLRSNTPTIASQNECKTKTVLQYRTPKNAALLYRLSGDYNPIHVEDNIFGSGNRSSDNRQDARDGNSGEKTPKRGAILHGLCTMGYALRAVLQHADNHHRMNKSHGGEIKLTSVRCNFVKPVYVGDSLRVEVWDEEDRTRRDKTVRFRVFRCVGCAGDGEEQNHYERDAEMVVDKGKAQFSICGSETGVIGTVSRL
mmetsp:Transcript_27789/g.57971  ORF Transcript_27789/g.57971 Transcript_27789/m.57971 type:complete len:434 (-) Transcript_27789:34-1335(-)